MPLRVPPSSPCSFCDYLSGVRPYTIVEHGEHVAIFVTYEQRGHGHMLVLPVQHRVTLLDLTAVERAAIMDGVVRATRAVVGAFDPEGVVVWQNNGVAAHQTVPHVHFHVAGTLPGGGTASGSVGRLALAETDRIGARLREHLPTTLG